MEGEESDPEVVLGNTEDCVMMCEALGRVLDGDGAVAQRLRGRQSGPGNV